MSKTQSIDTGVPAAFRAGDGLETNSAITEALGAIGGPPKGWAEVLQRAREAEFLLFRATSTGLAEDIARLEQHLAEITARRQSATGMAIADLDLGIANTSLLIQNTRTLLAACPGEAERVATHRARDQRRLRYERRSSPQNNDEVTAILDLTEQVQADTAEQAKEQAVVNDLYADVLAAHRAATRLLVRELTSSIHDAARVCKSAVGSKALRHAAFPQHADPAIGRSYSTAMYLSGLIARLGGEPIDVEKTFEVALGEDDWRTLTAVFRHQLGRYLISNARRG